MSQCDIEISSLPNIGNNCPSNSTNFLVQNVPALITPQNPGGYGLITWQQLLNCFGAAEEPLRLIVDETGAPVSGTSIWQNDSLKGLGGTSGRIQIFIDDAPSTNYGATSEFTFDPIAGEIDISPNQWFTGTNVYVSLNQ